MSRRWYYAWIGWLICPAALAFQVPVDAEPIRLGAVFSYSGRNMNNDASTVRVVRQMVVMQNARGGLLGRPIELLELDTTSRAAQGEKLAQQAISAGVSAVIGPNLSAQSLAIAPTLQNAGIPMISPSATIPGLTDIGNFIFRTNFTDDDQSTAISQFAYQHLHAKTAVVITDVSQKYSQNLSKLFMQQFRQLGGDILWQAEIIQNSVNFHTVLRKIRVLAPDVLIVAAYGQEAGVLMRQMEELQLKTPVICGDGCSADMGKIGEKAPYALYSVVYWHPDLRKTGDPVLNLTGFEPRQQLIAAIAFDATQLLFKAIQDANSSEPEQIRRALQKPWQGVTGYYHFGQSRDPHKPVVFVRHHSTGPILEVALLPHRPVTMHEQGTP